MAWPKWIWKRWVIIGVAVVAVLGVLCGGVIWWKFFQSAEQDLKNDAERFNYGSLGGEVVGIPYPIFMILPRVFPDLVEKYARQGYGPEKAGYGGYGAFGFSWEEGRPLPVGMSIKKLGYERVTVNCALCHTTSYRLKPDDNLQFAFGGPGHTVNMQNFLRFLFAAADDARFTATRMLPEMAVQFPFDWLDYAIYSTILIPKTRAALRVGRGQMGWMDGKTAWGPGRDDAFNLPKYLLARFPWDETIGNTDFPAVWPRTSILSSPLRPSASDRRPSADSRSAIAGSRALSASSRRPHTRGRSTRVYPRAGESCTQHSAPPAMRMAAHALGPQSRSPRSALIPSMCEPGRSGTRIA